MVERDKDRKCGFMLLWGLSDQRGSIYLWKALLRMYVCITLRPHVYLIPLIMILPVLNVTTELFVVY